MSSKRWFPLECNPEVMDRYIRRLGVKESPSAGQVVEFTDVFGFEPELLGMVPPTVRAVLLLYPITAENETAAQASIAAQGAVDTADPNSSPFFLRQTISNACGTVGLVHAIMNNRDVVTFESESFFHKFATATVTMTPVERAAALEVDDRLEEQQAVATSEGQTENQHIDTDINTHFICYVEQPAASAAAAAAAPTAGAVPPTYWRLDGRLPQPLRLPTVPGQSLLEAAADDAKRMMALNPQEVNFSCVAMIAHAA